MHNVWNKPVHKRRTWNSFSWHSRLIYYMQPLVEHMFDIWMQPLPFPTLLKFGYSCILTFLILLPALYPLMVLLFYYGIFQFICERHYQAEFPANWDLLGKASELCNFENNHEIFGLPRFNKRRRCS